MHGILSVTALEFGMATSSEYCDLKVRKTSQNYEQIQYMADNDKNVLSGRGSGLDLGLAAHSTSSEYCDLTVRESSRNYEQIQYMADNDENDLSGRSSGLEVAMAAHSTSSEYCELTMTEASHNYAQIQYLADNGQTFLSERVSWRRCLTKRQRLNMLLVVMLFLGVIFIVLIAVFVSSKHSDIDECDPNPCQHGRCLNEVDKYACICETGFKGTNCEKNIDFCSPNPCMYGVCADGVETYQCECFPGFNGTNCDQDVDECISNICIHGVCQDGIDGYNCTCFNGYTGLKCEQDIDFCSPNPCMYGICTDGVETYQCECFAGFDGTNCDQDVDECISNTCIHGVCQDGIDGYNCTCFNGYTGIKCEQDIDFCSPKPCMYGVCADGVETYQCECFVGFNGTNCDQESLASKNFLTGPIETDTKTMYVNYSLVSGQDTFSDLRACAEEFTDNQFLAVRVNEGTGKCEGLDWDWGGDPQYDEGYAYLRKTKTVDSYQPPFQVNKQFQWLLPGTFGVGGSVELYISIRRDMSSTEFEIMMLDKEKYLSVYDGDPEVIMVYAQIKIQNGFASVHFKIWNAGWSNKLYLSKTSVADGNAHKFTFVPQANIMQIFIDDTKVLEYTHPTDPATAKAIVINPYAIPTVELHNITFIAV